MRAPKKIVIPGGLHPHQFEGTVRTITNLKIRHFHPLSKDFWLVCWVEQTRRKRGLSAFTGLRRRAGRYTKGRKKNSKAKSKGGWVGHASQVIGQVRLIRLTFREVQLWTISRGHLKPKSSEKLRGYTPLRPVEKPYD